MYFVESNKICFMRDFIRANRTQISLLPPSIDEWLPENHLARFVVEVV